MRKSLDLYVQAFSDPTLKHGNHLEDDKQFEEEETWLIAVQETFLRLKIDTEDYIQHMSAKVHQDSQGVRLNRK